MNKKNKLKTKKIFKSNVDVAQLSELEDIFYKIYTYFFIEFFNFEKKKDYYDIINKLSKE